MEKITFLLVEDSKDDANKIKRSIKKVFRTLKKNYEIDFIDLDIEKHCTTDKAEKAVLVYIDNAEIASLVLDYQLIPNNGHIDGNEVFERIISVVPRFPVIMLTQLPKECKGENNVDFDKIYEKSDLISSNDGNNDKQVEIVTKLISNAEQYVNKVSSIKNAIDKIQNSRQFNLSEYIKLENELDGFLPNYVTKSVLGSFNNDYKELLELIREANKYVKK